MIRPDAIARALGGSRLMIDEAKLHSSWREFWESIDNVTWLGTFAAQVGCPRATVLEILDATTEIVTEALSLDPVVLAKGPADGDVDSALGVLPEAERSRLRAYRSILEECRSHADMLPSVMAVSRNALICAGRDAVCDQLCEAFRARLAYDVFLERLRASPWLEVDYPPVAVMRATLSRPLTDGRSRVRTTKRQRLFVIDTWLSVVMATREVHHPLRHVSRLELSKEPPWRMRPRRE